MLKDTFTQPIEQNGPLFVDHCSHLTFVSETNPDNNFQDEFESHRNAKHVDECGNYILGGPGNCHRSNQTI